jgi:hypothetical protein
LSRDSDASDPSIEHSPTLSRGYDCDYDALRLTLPRSSCHSRRNYSSTLAYQQDSRDEETTRIRLATNRLLDPKQTPSFDDALWTEAQDVLKWWISNTSTNSSTEAVDTCFDLLDRLEGELPKDEFLFGSLLETELLDSILVAWRNIYQFQQNNTSTLLPSEVALKMDKYRWCSLVQPDCKTFNILLDAARYTTTTDPKEGVLFAASLLEKLLQVSEQQQPQTSLHLVDVVTFSTVMNLWVQSGLPQGPQKAQDLLDRLQTLYNSQHERWEDLQPNSVVYTTVIHGWARVGDASKATYVLQQQLQDYKHGNAKAQPDSQTFNAVLHALSKSRTNDSHTSTTTATSTNGNETPPHQQAEQVVAQMRAYQCPPDSYSFTNLLTCWANSKHARAAEKTEGILRDMLELVESGETRVRLDIVAYNTGKCVVVLCCVVLYNAYFVGWLPIYSCIAFFFFD